MFNTLTAPLRRDPDYPARTREIDVLRRMLEGRIYDLLTYEFHEERNDAGEYIPLKKRRPSVRHNLCRLAVEDSVALVFSEGHFPTLECTDAAVRESLLVLVKETRLARVMTDAAISGSVGSVAILMRVLKNRVFFEPMNTEYLTPAWRRDAPDTLAGVTEKYKVRRGELEERGYTLSDDHEWYWFQRVWDDQREIWYWPWPVAKEGAGPVEDPVQTVDHRLGFVPVVWIKNLPGPSASGSAVDGACTFRAGIETTIEIEYQLSQAGRGLKYSSDPTLLIKEPAFGDQQQFVRSAANALIVSKDGDGRLLEINGTAAAAVIEYCRALREMALEGMHGNRSNADKLSAAQSGRALELMHQALIWLADHLRQSYGEDGLLPLIRMVMRLSRQFPLLINGKPLTPIADDVQVSLKWPPWFPPTGEDRVQEANGLATLRVAGIMSRETAVKAVAETWDIEDVQHELGLIATDEKAIIAGTELPPTGQTKQVMPGPNGNQGKGGDTPP
jgi:hypothetical protein